MKFPEFVLYMCVWFHGFDLCCWYVCVSMYVLEGQFIHIYLI